MTNAKGSSVGTDIKAGKAGFPCPECGNLASLATSTSSFRTKHMVLRGRRCPNDHQFVTMEATLDNMQWFELQKVIESISSNGNGKL